MHNLIGVFALCVLLATSAFARTGEGHFLQSNLTLTHPNGGEEFRIGTPIPIRWEGGGTADSVLLEYSDNAGRTWHYLAWVKGNTYLWTPPKELVGKALKVRVRGPWKEGPEPFVQWVRPITGTINERINASFVDPSGDIYVGGVYEGPTTLDEATVLACTGLRSSFIARYSHSGKLKHAWTITSAGQGNATLNGICRDSAGNILVTGFFRNIAILNDNASVSSHGGDQDNCIFTASFSPNGTLRWVRRIALASTPSNERSGFGICADAKGNCYIAGDGGHDMVIDDGSQISGPIWGNSGRYLFVASYDSEGNFRWIKHAVDTFRSGYTSGANGLCIDNSGEYLYVGGSFGTSFTFDDTTCFSRMTTPAAIVLKCRTGNGGLMWARRIGGNTAAASGVVAVYPDSEGGVYADIRVGGYTASHPSTAWIPVGTDSKVLCSLDRVSDFVVRFDSTGAIGEVSDMVEGVAGTTDAGGMKDHGLMAVDRSGTIYMTATAAFSYPPYYPPLPLGFGRLFYRDSSDMLNMFVASISRGRFVNVKGITAVPRGPISPLSIAVGTGGNVYVSIASAEGRGMRIDDEIVENAGSYDTYLVAIQFPDKEEGDADESDAPWLITQPIPEVPKKEYNLGSVFFGDTRDTVFTSVICNRGNAPLYITGFGLNGNTRAIRLLEVPADTTLLPGECLPLTVSIIADHLQQNNAPAGAVLSVDIFTDLDTLYGAFQIYFTSVPYIHFTTKHILLRYTRPIEIKDTVLYRLITNISDRPVVLNSVEPRIPFCNAPEGVFEILPGYSGIDTLPVVIPPQSFYTIAIRFTPVENQANYGCILDFSFDGLPYASPLEVEASEIVVDVPDPAQGPELSLHAVVEDGNLSLSYRSSRYGTIKVLLVNSIGREVFSKDIVIPSPGEYYCPIPTNRLAAGIYFCIMQTDRGSVTRQIVIHP